MGTLFIVEEDMPATLWSRVCVLHSRKYLSSVSREEKQIWITVHATVCASCISSCELTVYCLCLSESWFPRMSLDPTEIEMNVPDYLCTLFTCTVTSHLCESSTLTVSHFSLTSHFPAVESRLSSQGFLSPVCCDRLLV